jgi:CheY-like chemotaxis protein
MAFKTGPARPVVLIVEDEPFIRLGAVDLIESAGFEVVEARNADEAIEILSARRDIRIVFTDIEMPGSMDGLKLAAAVRDRWPPIEIIIASGKMSPPPHAIPARGVFVAKPYSEASLVGALRKFVG